MTGQAGAEVVTARFGRLPARGVLLGFTGPRLVAVAVAIGVLIPSLFLGGLAGAVFVSPLVAVLLASAFVPVAGRTAVEWLPVGGHWALRRVLRQDVFRVRPTRPRPAGSLALPGEAAALRFHTDPVSGAVMVHDPHRGTLAATAVVTHPAFVLLSPSDQARRVAAWGRVLSVLAGTGQTAAVQVLEATIPDSGQEVLDWWSDNRATSGWAADTYDEFVQSAAPATARHRTTVTITLDLKQAARAVRQAGRGVTGAAAVLRQDMGVLEAALRSAELRVARWLDADGLARVVRGAYDPAAPVDEPAGGQLSTAGPVGIVERWSSFTTDGGAHVSVLWVSEWPRSEAFPNFLHTLILRAGVRKSFSLVVHPVSVAAAMKDIRRQKAEYLSDAAQKQRIGQIADFADEAEYTDIQRRERELVAGHADLHFAGFLAVTAPTADELDIAVAEIQRAAIQCGCDTRVLVGQQTQAFTAAALPLGRGL